MLGQISSRCTGSSRYENTCFAGALITMLLSIVVTVVTSFPDDTVKRHPTPALEPRSSIEAGAARFSGTQDCAAGACLASGESLIAADQCGLRASPERPPPGLGAQLRRESGCRPCAQPPRGRPATPATAWSREA